jgi:hypothetical protein
LNFETGVVDFFIKAKIFGFTAGKCNGGGADGGIFLTYFVKAILPLGMCWAPSRGRGSSLEASTTKLSTSSHHRCLSELLFPFLLFSAFCSPWSDLWIFCAVQPHRNWLTEDTEKLLMELVSVSSVIIIMVLFLTFNWKVRLTTQGTGEGQKPSTATDWWNGRRESESPEGCGVRGMGRPSPHDKY